MTREQASSILAASRRLPVSRGRIVIRDAELASMIATVKAERRPAFTPGHGEFVNS